MSRVQAQSHTRTRAFAWQRSIHDKADMTESTTRPSSRDLYGIFWLAGRAKNRPISPYEDEVFWWTVHPRAVLSAVLLLWLVYHLLNMKSTRRRTFVSTLVIETKQRRLLGRWRFKSLPSMTSTNSMQYFKAIAAATDFRYTSLTLPWRRWV